MSDINLQMIERVAAYTEAMRDRYRFYLETVFFPVVDGKRQTLFTEEMSDYEEFLRLQEASTKSQMVARGEIEPDNDVKMWDENQDGAQERFAELMMKYQGAGNG